MRLRSFFENPSIHRGLFDAPYVIAEVGVNHEGNMEVARRLIGEAAAAGAGAIKFQTYKAETLASRDSPAYWDTSKESTKSQFDLFRKYDKFWKKEFEELKVCCDRERIEFLSTPFDVESVQFLNDLMDVFKISSSDITNKPFIELISDCGKPVILSTGASNVDEIKDAVEWIDQKEVPVAVLHCVLNYPTDDKSANLAMIGGLKREFPDRLIGYSDHTLPGDMKNLELAFLLGAEILEKHFTHDKNLPGNDHYHSMDTEDLKRFFQNMERVQMLMGREEKTALASEGPARRHARRSLVAFHDIAKGNKIGEESLTWKRPGHGISPRHIQSVIGRVAGQSICKDEVLQWDMLV